MSVLSIARMRQQAGLARRRPTGEARSIIRGENT